MLDWWSENHATTIRFPAGNSTILSRDQEVDARLTLLRKIRAQVGPDFLIIGNSNFSQVPRSAPDLNGIFMECFKQPHDRGYSRQELLSMERTLRWAELSSICGNLGSIAWRAGESSRI